MLNVEKMCYFTCEHNSSQKIGVRVEKARKVPSASRPHWRFVHDPSCILFDACRCAVHSKEEKTLKHENLLYAG